MKLSFYSLLLATFLFPLEFVVEPYLQSATQSSIYIMWETDSNSDSRVEWGTWPTLGEVTTGTSIASYGSNKLHSVQLTGLYTSSRYYYRVITGNLKSEIYDFFRLFRHFRLSGGWGRPRCFRRRGGGRRRHRLLDGVPIGAARRDGAAPPAEPAGPSPHRTCGTRGRPPSSASATSVASDSQL